MSTPGAVLAIVAAQREKAEEQKVLDLHKQQLALLEIKKQQAEQHAKNIRWKAWLDLKKAFTSGDDEHATENAETVNIELLASVWEDGYTALHSAAAQGLVCCCETIVTREDFLPSMLVVQDPRGYTPLHCAVLSADGGAEICALFANHEGCIVSLKDNDGRTAVDLAQEWGMDSAKAAIMSAIQLRYATVEARMKEEEAVAAEAAAVEAAQEMDMADRNNKKVFESPAGFRLFRAGRMEDLIVLVKSAWPFINQCDDEHHRYRTLLHHAAHKGESDVCEAVLDRDDFERCDHYDLDRVTALHLAAANRHVECCIAIIASGRCKGVNLQDMRDQTPLHLAAVRGDGECYNAILSHESIDLGVRDYKNRLAAEYAMDRGLEVDLPVIDRVDEHDLPVDDPDLEVDL